MAIWTYSCIDNGGKRQYFKIKAASKPEAIKKGSTRAKKNADGDVTSWDCYLIRA
jgi:hypothetical protein